ncbi:5-methyltetrahydropteroyltriglutamate--homocysteine S-methyltransferase [Actinocrispum wychmicini]|uniref:5-methyltetrahydropteroyltriglutamate--homocysteine methyltransferase n=1 Tax=Actinocrispum wychmicini TaxID=1213861 RepID=A0A4R2J705_9PSEU|nr:5-methyltetrahydropteroyltriglutamate--homocysteine S-methyltransferase [Actinocrispum wychmicini]TCO54284.1 methionine synthase (B12-independent) [Actinocrispum wychmicini]
MVDSSARGIGSTVLGYPRIGPRRELKRALEQYWSGALDAPGLRKVARQLRLDTWSDLAGRGLDSVPSNTFSYYDQVLDTALLFDAIPQRYRDLGLTGLDTYFAMARGHAEVGALELTKWFDTNYHYLVPEIGADTKFTLVGDKPIAEYQEARSAGVETRPVLLGPVTFLLLSKGVDGFVPLDALDSLVDCYASLLGQLAAAGVAWVQLDEPAFVADRSDAELAALGRVYSRLAGLSRRPQLLVAGYFGEFGPALPVLAETAVEGIAVDLVAGAGAVSQIPLIPGLRSKTLVAGVVDGRNIWRTDLRTAASTCARLRDAVGDIAVSTSCSLQHVPYDLAAETSLDPSVAARLAFARQKVDEVVSLGKDASIVAPEGVGRVRRDLDVRARIAALRPEDRRRVAYPDRAAAQAARLGLPPLATTTIGSFPQTSDIRKARADLRTGQLGEADYEGRMRAEIERVIRLQEDLGLDVLVHGEPERNDMVQYFGELLAGFAFTDNGWVQSYGSRCVRPPILHGDVSRPAPMTVPWATYAQSLTSRPVKGMLTGPVTILAWSFVRDDQPLGVTADQVALALRDEIRDLEAAGIGIIQVDEPALRELLPLRAEDRQAYLDWAVNAFRLATAGAAPSTQIHTHLCYSEFGDVIKAIDGLDADVTTIEAARSKMEVLADLATIGYHRGVGPGVYDIHSPRIPNTDEMADLLRAAVEAVPASRVWANPDCGLKTRNYTEVEPALRHLVKAAQRVRASL